jgi:hypothetical protein
MADDVIRPSGLVRERSVGTPTLLLTASFVAQWIDIAQEHEGAAKDARQRALTADADGDRQGRIEALQEEMHAAMVSVSAASHAIDALYGTVRDLIVLRPGTIMSGTSRPGRILETLKGGCSLGKYAAKWGKDFGWLFRLRDAAVHHEAQARPPVSHPAFPDALVVRELTEYTEEAATRATDLAVEVAVIVHETAKQPRLREWADMRMHWASAINERRPIVRLS